MGAPAVMALLLLQYRPGSALWTLGRLVRGTGALGRVRGMRFARVLGSGRDGGFGLWPSTRHQGLVGFFDDEDCAEAFLRQHAWVQACRRHAEHTFAATLRATSCRGSWGGATLAVTAEARPGQPVAALTRASIRPSRAWSFWHHAPPSEAGLDDAEGCRLAIGLGEAPVLRQCTFSLWDDSTAMDAYARGGAHQAAIRAAYGGGYFSESMFVRGVPRVVEDDWPEHPHG